MQEGSLEIMWTEIRDVDFTHFKKYIFFLKIPWKFFILVYFFPDFLSVFIIYLYTAQYTAFLVYIVLKYNIEYFNYSFSMNSDRKKSFFSKQIIQILQPKINDNITA